MLCALQQKLLSFTIQFSLVSLDPFRNKAILSYILENTRSSLYQNLRKPFTWVMIINLIFLLQGSFTENYVCVTTKIER